MSFPRYPKYKDSGVEWLGEVPEQWRVVPVRRAVYRIEQGWSPECLARPAEADEWGVLKSGCVNRGVFAQQENKALPRSLVPIPEYEIRPGNVLMCRASGSAKLVGSTALVTVTRPRLMLSDKIFRLHPHPTIEPNFLAYAFNAEAMREQIERAISGADGLANNLPQSALKQFACAVPPDSEQHAIATFLDRETAKIDALVAEQRRLIGLLKEKRQAVITHAVTQGLNPAAAMKPSGIEWLGDVPAQWHNTPLKWLTDPDRPIMYGIVLPGPDVGEGVPVLKGGNVKPSRMNLESMARTTPEIEAPYARARLRGGDLVYSIRGSIGDCEAVPSSLEGSNITQDVARIAVAEGTCAGWVRWGLLSSPVREELASSSLGAAVRGVNIFDLKRVALPTPPSSEQVAIAAYLDIECDICDRLISEAHRAIDLLQERRTALISAAVTGQIDVRGLVPSEAA